MPTKTTVKEEKGVIAYTCSDCGEKVYESEGYKYKKHNGELICQECFDKDYFLCVDCGDIFSNEVMREGAGEEYCDSCWAEKFFECDGCGNVTRMRYRYTAVDDNEYCESCYSERFTSCEECGESGWRDDMFYDEEHDGYYCATCRQRCPKVIHQYSYKPTPEFYKLPHEVPFYMGIELEVETGEADKKAFELLEHMKQEKIEKYYYFKYDGSVNGFEIVSHPFTLGFMHKNMKLYSVLNWLRRNGCKSYGGGKCGFHVHVSSNFFEDNDTGKLRTLFSVWKDQLLKFSRRKGNTDFCRFEHTMRRQWIKNGENGDLDRYRAVNFLNDSTIEYRLFRGTLNHLRLLASMQFSDAISSYVKFIGASAPIMNAKWEDFMKWCQREGKYHHFVQYCSLPSVNLYNKISI